MNRNWKWTLCYLEKLGLTCFLNKMRIQCGIFLRAILPFLGRTSHDRFVSFGNDAGRVPV